MIIAYTILFGEGVSDLDKPICSNMKVVTCPECGKMIQKSRSTMSESACFKCSCSFNAFVEGDFVMYYNSENGESKELATIII